MPSFSDSIFLFVLALLLFGPKKLPKLARELGRWVGEFRRASNEFKMQMEEELRISEQEERNQKIAAMEAAAPVPPALPTYEEPSADTQASAADSQPAAEILPAGEPAYAAVSENTPDEPAPEPLPIASAGSLNVMPPDTGLPTPQSRTGRASADPVAGLLGSIPSDDTPTRTAESRDAASPVIPEETAAHG